MLIRILIERCVQLFEGHVEQRLKSESECADEIRMRNSFNSQGWFNK